MTDKQSLTMNWGGFMLNSCSPILLNFYTCSRCTYCFATLNEPNRKVYPEQVVNTFLNYKKQDKDGKWQIKTLVGHLLREGYPILYSNLIDPFSVENVKTSYQIIPMMVDMGIPFSLQTKGGKHIYPLLKDMPPIVWYISIAIDPDREDIRKRVEPGAPPTWDRIKLIQYLVQAGHSVLVGINPIVPQWLPDPEKLIAPLAKAGVSGAWMQPLHLSRNQVKRMPDSYKEGLGEETIEMGLNFRKYPEMLEKCHEARAIADRYGIPTYNGQQRERSDYFAPYRKYYKKTYPLMQDFVNYCYDTKQPGDIILKDEFLDFFVPQLPRGVWSLRDHLNAIAIQQLLYGKYIPQRMSYKRLLSYCWKYPETVLSPVNVDCFGWAGKYNPDEENWIEYEHDGDPILVFQPDLKHRECYVDIDLG